MMSTAAHTNTRTHTHTHTRTLTSARKATQTNIRTLKQTHTHPQTLTRIHTHTRTLTMHASASAHAHTAEAYNRVEQTDVIDISFYSSLSRSFPLFLLSSLYHGLALSFCLCPPLLVMANEEEGQVGVLPWSPDVREGQGRARCKNFLKVTCK